MIIIQNPNNQKILDMEETPEGNLNLIKEIAR